MDDVFFMGGFEGVGDLPGDPEGFFERASPLRDVLGQRGAGCGHVTCEG
jgi:hypothetical protein